MRNRIKLSYWNIKDIPNFGDLLSPYIIKKLTNRDISYIEWYFGIKRILKTIILSVLMGKWEKLRELHYPFEKVILGVGSILSFSSPGCIVWGSGFMNYNEKFRGGRILLVRGPVTRDMLLKQKFKCPMKYGDPAILLPLIYNPVKKIKYKIGIIPHWKETSYFKDNYSSLYHIIDLRTTEIEKTIDEILSCSYILSTSLHGLIVSHSYGIPALWIQNNNIDTDGFKFADYFASVKIQQYKGFINIKDILKSEERILSLFKEYHYLSLPQIDINIIQKTILETAPFKIKNNIINLI